MTPQVTWDAAADEGRLEGELAALEAMSQSGSAKVQNCILTHRRLSGQNVNPMNKASTAFTCASVNPLYISFSTVSARSCTHTLLTTHNTQPAMLNSYMDVSLCYPASHEEQQHSGTNIYRLLKTERDTFRFSDYTRCNRFSVPLASEIL